MLLSDFSRQGNALHGYLPSAVQAFPPDSWLG